MTPRWYNDLNEAVQPMAKSVVDGGTDACTRMVRGRDAARVSE
jgi:hypothetical protein